MAKITIDATGSVSDIATQLHGQLSAELQNKQQSLDQLVKRQEDERQAAQAEIDQFTEWVADLEAFVAAPRSA